jgi:hypothetical protein
VSWALTLEGRADPAGIILLLDDKEEAEIIAREVRRNGTPIVIRPYPSRELSDARAVGMTRAGDGAGPGVGSGG